VTSNDFRRQVNSQRSFLATDVSDMYSQPNYSCKKAPYEPNHSEADRYTTEQSPLHEYNRDCTCPVGLARDRDCSLSTELELDRMYEDDKRLDIFHSMNPQCCRGTTAVQCLSSQGTGSTELTKVGGGGPLIPLYESPTLTDLMTNSPHHRSQYRVDSNLSVL